MAATRRKFGLGCLGGMFSVAVPQESHSLDPTNTPRPLLQTDLFVAGQCIDCDVAGYVVLRSQHPFRHLFEAPSEFQIQLGPMLARLEAVIIEVTGADHVYLARFSEAMASVHFHLFPRTPVLGQQFIDEARNQEHGVNGPLLFDWARRKYHIDEPSQFSASTLKASDQIRGLLRKG